MKPIPMWEARKWDKDGVKCNKISFSLLLQKMIDLFHFGQQHKQMIWARLKRWKYVTKHERTQTHANSESVRLFVWLTEALFLSFAIFKSTISKCFEFGLPIYFEFDVSHCGRIFFRKIYSWNENKNITVFHYKRKPSDLLRVFSVFDYQ